MSLTPPVGWKFYIATSFGARAYKLLLIPMDEPTDLFSGGRYVAFFDYRFAWRWHARKLLRLWHTDRALTRKLHHR